jgi:PKD repeat protein
VVVSAKTTVDAGQDVTGVEGAAIRLAGNATGAGKPAWRYRAVSGVDTGATCKIANAAALTTTITCTDDGTYEVTLANGKITDSATVTVTNAAPKIESVKGPAGQVKSGAPVTVTATFTDPGSNDRLTCVVDWRDGSTSTGTVTGGRCTAGHTYRAGGSYQVTVTVTDDDGGSDSHSVRVKVAAPGTSGGVTVPIIGGKLPITGFPAIMALSVGVGLLVLGVVLFRMGRVRRARSSGADS